MAIGQVPNESYLQKALVDWLFKQPEYEKKFVFTHPATEGKRSPQYRRLLANMGVANGDPDLIFFLSEGRIKFVELKMPKGQLTPNQKKRIPILVNLGHQVLIIKTDDICQAKQEIWQFLSL